MYSASNLWVVSQVKYSEYSWNTEVPVTVFTSKSEAEGQAAFLNGPWLRKGMKPQYEVLRLNERIENIIENAINAAQYSDGE